MHSQGSSGGPFILVGIVFIVIGALNIAKPDLNWKMRRWQYRNRDALEPSAAALTVTRVAGAVAVVAGIVVIVIGASR